MGTYSGDHVGGGNLRVPQHQGVREAVASLAINIGGEAADVKREVGVERSLKAGIPPGSRRDSAPLCRTRSDDVPRAYRHPSQNANGVIAPAPKYRISRPTPFLDCACMSRSVHIAACFDGG
jgi:hypothetical protein